MKAELRAPISSDYAVIASWIPDAIACRRWAGSRLSFPFAAADLPSLLAIPGGEASYCLIENNALVQGFGQHWVRTPGAVHLGRIIVAPGARGKGLGRVLCQSLIAKAIQSTGASTVTLRAYTDNPVAVALYTSLGFAVVEEESTQDELFMKMLLADPSTR